MQYQKIGDQYFLKIEQGEAVMAKLTQFCIDHGIHNARISGIGAVSSVSCGYYALAEQRYYFTNYDELLEVVSLSGNVLLKAGAPFVHLHGVFTNTKNEAFGGHIEEMVVGVVLEVFLEPLPSTIERVQNPKIGLALAELATEASALTDPKTSV